MTQTEAALAQARDRIKKLERRIAELEQANGSTRPQASTRQA